MGTYVVTGSASGIGAAIARRLRQDGHNVIGVDILDAGVVADLSTPDGRRDAAQRVATAAGGHLDGAVLAAGLGPTGGARRLRMIAEVNYRGVTELLEQWQPSLAAAGNAKVVVVGSNSTTTVPAVPRRTIRALLADDLDKALAGVRCFGPARPAIIYAASKTAVTWWVRRRAVEPRWIGHGIRLNVLAPGAVMTPLLQEQLADRRQGRAVQRFPIPVGEFGDADTVSRWAAFMLTDAADQLCGSVVVVDGGTEAHFRADDWPRPVPLRHLPTYLRRFRG